MPTSKGASRKKNSLLPHREQVAIQQRYERTTTRERITAVVVASRGTLSFCLQLLPWVSLGSLPLTTSLSVYRTGWPSAPAIWLHSPALSRISLSFAGQRDSLSWKMLAWKPCESWGCGKSPEKKQIKSCHVRETMHLGQEYAEEREGSLRKAADDFRVYQS